MDKDVKFKLAPHVHKALKLQAEKQGRTMAQYCADIVEEKMYGRAALDPLIKAALNEGPRPLSLEGK